MNELITKSKKFTLGAVFNSKSILKGYCDDFYHGAGLIELYFKQMNLINKLYQNYPKIGEITEIIVKRKDSDLHCNFKDYEIQCIIIEFDIYLKKLKNIDKTKKFKALIVSIDYLKNTAFVIIQLKNKDTIKNKIDEIKELSVVKIEHDFITCIDINDLKNLYFATVKKTFGEPVEIEKNYIKGQIITCKISRIINDNMYIVIPNDYKTHLMSKGEFEQCRVNNINGLFIYVHLKSTNELGRIHVSEITNNLIEFENPLEKIMVSNILNASIVGHVEFKNSMNKKAFKKNIGRLLEMSLINKDLSHYNLLKDLKINQKIYGFVKEIQKNVIVVSLGIDIIAYIDKIEFLQYNLNFDFTKLTIGTILHCIILSFNKSHNNYDKFINEDLDQNIINLGLVSNINNIKIGDCCYGRIIKYIPHMGQLVKLSNNKYSILPITEIQEEFVKFPHLIYKIKQIIKCIIINVDQNKITISTKESLFTKNNRNCIKKSIDDFGPIGTIIEGYIKQITSTYAIVMFSYNISSKITGNAFKNWFSIQMVKNIKLPSLVKAKIISKTEKNLGVVIIEGNFDMKETHQGYLTDPLIDPLNRKNLEQNLEQNSEKYSEKYLEKYLIGKITKIDKQLGIYVDFEKNHGFIPLTQVSNTYQNQPLEMFKISDELQVEIKAQSKYKNTLLCSLRNNTSENGDINFENTFEIKAEQFVNGYIVFISSNYITVSISLNVVAIIPENVLKIIPQNEIKSMQLGQLLNLQVLRVLDKYHVEVILKNIDKSLICKLTTIRTEAKPTKVVIASNLNRIDKISTLNEINNVNINNVTVDKQVDNIEKEEIFKDLTFLKDEKEIDQNFDNPLLEEKYIRNREKSIIKGDLVTTEDYERNVISDPNNSQNWIQYIVFIMEYKKNIEEARHLIKRALNSINFNFEKERFNIWLCWLNLENEFGTDESMNNVYKQALQLCDKKKLFQKLSNIYYVSKYYIKAEEIFNLMIKKYNNSKKSWLLYLNFLYQQNRVEDARKLLPRALRILPKKKRKF